MHFRIAHELEIPRDALELAVVSPDLIDRLQSKLGKMKAVQKRHALENGKLERVWTFSRSTNLRRFGDVSWDQHTSYELAKHESSWEIIPDMRPEWQKYFHAKGTYALVQLGEAKTQRIVEGDVELRVPVVSRAFERLLLAQVRKAFEAEAETLRDMATLT